jgi:Uncharacterized conserved protein
VTEVSLNFAAFARLLRQPSGIVERALGRALVVGDAWFQIERLYRLQREVLPALGAALLHVRAPARLPRAGIAALWLEGQLPKPSVRRRLAPPTA